MTTHFQDRLVVSDIPDLLEITLPTEEALLFVGFPSDSSRTLFLNPAGRCAPGPPGPQASLLLLTYTLDAINSPQNTDGSQIYLSVPTLLLGLWTHTPLTQMSQKYPES